ncbi:MAG: cytochrome c oxidase assembly protein [Actinomycetota bacterium]|jgi:putative membrane protein|nr:cytochrome c oxidase assembly protein [Actinomycetota bacterium]
MGVDAAYPSWHPHVDTWLLVIALAAAYAVAVARLGPRHAAPGRPPVTKLQAVCFSLGVAAIWVASDWPVHDIAEELNYSMHMVQHLVLSMVAAPLLLLGTPAWMLRSILRPPSQLFRAVRFLSRFLPALIVFNVVLVLTHWPAIVDASLENHLLHFLVHALIFVSALIIWMPVLSPLPEIPRLSPPPRMIFLFLQSVVPTIPASFLTFGSSPLYHFYDGVPHLWGLSTLDDQRLAGLIMKIGAGLLLWMLIAVIFFRWAGEEDRRIAARRRWQDLDRELTRMGTTST